MRGGPALFLCRLRPRRAQRAALILSGGRAAVRGLAARQPLRAEHDQGHGKADQGHAAPDRQGGGLIENDDAHQHGGERFRGPQHGGQGRADALYGQHQGQIGNDGRHQRLEKNLFHLPAACQPLKAVCGQGVAQRGQGAEKQQPEGDDQAVGAAQTGGKDAGDVERVAQGREQGQDQPLVRDAALAWGGVAQQENAAQGQQDAQGCHGGEALPEEKHHEKHDHDRIEKVDGGGHAAGQIGEAPEKGQGRQHVHEAYPGQLGDVAAAGRQNLAAGQQNDGHDDGGRQKTVEEHRLRTEAAAHERNAEEGGQAESGRGQQAVEKAHVLSCRCAAGAWQVRRRQVGKKGRPPMRRRAGCKADCSRFAPCGAASVKDRGVRAHGFAESKLPRKRSLENFPLSMHFTEY